MPKKETAGQRRAAGTAKAAGNPVVHSRMDEPLYKWLIQAAEQDGRTVSSYVERLVRKEKSLSGKRVSAGNSAGKRKK